MKSTHAAAASVLRKELKKAYPLTIFKVTSNSFSGGTSIRVSWTDGPACSSVRAITKNYEYGTYDAMNDIYEYKKDAGDVPQVKYVICNRYISKEVREKAIQDIKTKFDMDLNNDREVYNRTGLWPQQFIDSYISKHLL